MSAYGARQFVAWLTVSASFDGRGFSKGVQQRLDATQDEADKALVLRDATFRALYSTPDPIRQLGHLKACRRLVGNLVSEQSAPAPGHDEIYREEMQGVVARGKALLDNAERGGLLDVRGLQSSLHMLIEIYLMPVRVAEDLAGRRAERLAVLMRCPLTGDILDDPVVIDGEGYSYSRHAMQWTK